MGSLAFNKPYLLKQNKADQTPTGMTLAGLKKYFSCSLCVKRVTHVLYSILENYLSWDVFIPEAARAQEQRWARAILILDSFWWATKLTGAAFRCAFPRHGRLHTVGLSLQWGKDWLQRREDVREALDEHLEARGRI